MDNKLPIPDNIYRNYFDCLLKSNRFECSKIVENLLSGDTQVKDLYENLFQRSLYETGELWEMNKISVAREHLVTALTESLLNLVYPHLFKSSLQSKNSAIISCSANEFHQIGGKMTADILETHGWQTYFLGANTPADEMLRLIDELKPDLVGLSLSIYFNMPALKECIASIRNNFSGLEIVFGGQAFRFGASKALSSITHTSYIANLDELEQHIGEK